MAHRTWKYGILLGLVGVALASGCVVKSDDGEDDDATAGEGGESGSSTGGKGGSSTGGKGGSSGSATGGTAGTTTGGSSGSATGGSSGAGMGGSMPDTTPECDPDTGELDNTPYPDCEPTDAEDPCELCIEENCCAESRVCYGYDPGNVCGWGGIDLDDDDVLDGEITCYVACARAYVEENGAYDEMAVDECTGMCATEECGLIGNATQDLVVCIEGSCEDECFVP
jgi:hypothetical protein